MVLHWANNFWHSHKNFNICQAGAKEVQDHQHSAKYNAVQSSGLVVHCKRVHTSESSAIYCSLYSGLHSAQYSKVWYITQYIIQCFLQPVLNCSAIQCNSVTLGWAKCSLVAVSNLVHYTVYTVHTVHPVQSVYTWLGIMHLQMFANKHITSRMISKARMKRDNEENIRGALPPNLKEDNLSCQE